MNIAVPKGVLENILTNLQPFLEKDASQITSHILLEAMPGKLTGQSNRLRDRTSRRR